MNPSGPVLSSIQQPGFDEIVNSISGPASVLWQDLNSTIQQEWKAAPKITYSRCAGKPGWNVKYRKSGKSLCTLYPEPQGFTALVVITLAAVPQVIARQKEFTPYVIGMVKDGKPYNGTLWLMIQVTDERVANDVKRLLELKENERPRMTE